MRKRGPQSHFILGAGVRVLRAWPEPEPGPLDLSPDGASLVYGPECGRVLVCREVESGRERWRSALSGSTTSLRYSPDGARLAASTLHGHVAVLDAETGRVLREHRVSGAPVSRR
jgi:WD40 repeat protein